MSKRAETLAERVIEGATALLACAAGLTDKEWNTPCIGDGRTLSVLVHHVATMYPAEIDLVRVLASGKAIVGVTWEMVAQINAQHAQEYAAITKPEALDLLQRNSQTAAESIREFTDEQLDQAAPVSLNWNVPLTAQYFIEEHPISHSFRHLADIQKTLGREV